MSTLNQKYDIQPIAESDISVVAAHILSSHLSQPPYQLVFPDWAFNTATILSHYTQSLTIDFKDPGIEILKATHRDTKEIVASIVLIRRKLPPATQPAQSSQSSSNISDGRAWGQWQSVIQDVEKPMVGIEHLGIKLTSSMSLMLITDTHHPALAHLSTLPSHRKQGIATSLLELAKQRAHQISLPFFICSPPSTRLFFAKNGFVTNGVVEVDLSTWSPASGADPRVGFGKYTVSSMLASVGFS